MSRGAVPASIATSTVSAASGSGRFSHHQAAPAAAAPPSTTRVTRTRQSFMDGMAPCGPGKKAGNDNRRMSTTVSIAGIVPLAHWGVIRARGADAASFLHSQLTNDFAALGPTTARLAGYCSPKGRLLASFVAWKAGDED